MSEKTKITLQVKVVNDPTSENVKVEIDSGITFLQLTKEVLKKLLTSKDKHPHGVLIAICGHIINMKILKDKKITLIPKGDSEKQCLFSVKSLAIRNESIINIVWIDKEIDFCFSWDAMEEKSIEIETAQNEKKIISKYASTDLNLISQGKGKWLQQLLKKILLVIDVVCAGSATITFALPFLTNLSVPIV